MKKDGITHQDLVDIRMIQDEKKAKDAIEFYSDLAGQQEFDLNKLDLAAPFSLYSSQVRLGFLERINLLERESCKAYVWKVAEFKDRIIIL